MRKNYSYYLINRFEDYEKNKFLLLIITQIFPFSFIFMPTYLLDCLHYTKMSTMSIHYGMLPQDCI